MPRTNQQNKEIRDATRAALLDSAMRLFAENGYHHTSVRMIASQSCVSTGLLYHYFENKEALLEAVFENCMAIISRGFEDALQAEAPLDRIEGILDYIVSALERERVFWGLFYSLRAQPAAMSVLGEGFRLWTGRLRDLLTALFEAAGRQDCEIQAYLLYSLIEGTIQQYLLQPETYPLADVAAAIHIHIQPNNKE